MPLIQFHGSDILNIYFNGELTDYLVHFTNHLDPNGRGLHHWPQYNTSTRSVLTLWDGFVPITITDDTYRQDAMNVLTNLSLAHPLS
jgi:acetylcholinesterase